ncbi:hypothetical protein EJ05DRAFT_221100 [Pseudovirgaria hyperparasitica]|uniref:Uncharacterized protein n=1 Tax=Pseudovirgaria hyperparasitica TaxID=470096 RepID=A0A6A6VUG7_9PEZI|nr:uncharacterized protein EJ05DRAFT_221100 [Pseudovirgaria hyperparasitica]KAF2753539.1 hypothetical protein EJ05DRAFT_221100 [Pseudovirgaria hyperparasitica]
MVFRHPMTRVSRRRAQSYSSASSASTSSTADSIDTPTTAPQPSALRRRRNHSIGEALISPALLIMRSELFTPRTPPRQSTYTSSSALRPPSPSDYVSPISASSIPEMQSPIDMPAIMITDEHGHEEVYHDDEIFEPFELDCAPAPQVRERSPLRDSAERRRRGRSLERGVGRERSPSPNRRRRIQVSEREIIDQ